MTTTQRAKLGGRDVKRTQNRHTIPADSTGIQYHDALGLYLDRLLGEALDEIPPGSGAPSPPAVDKK